MTDDHWDQIDLSFDIDPVFDRNGSERSLESDDIFATVQEAREAYWRGAESSTGATCPVCERKGRVYKKRTITKAMATVLVELYKLRAAQPETGWVHVDEYLDELGADNKTHADFPKLRYWGLLEAQPGVRPDGSKRVGFWRITYDGMRFAAGKSAVPKYAKVYNNACRGLWGPDITIRDVRGFNYNELMGGTET